MNGTSALGLYAERLAADFLRARSYTILETNFRRKWGEVDIVAEKQGILVFVEVKASREHIAGFEPHRRANSEKMRKVFRTARTFLAATKRPSDQEWQVDIIGVSFQVERGAARVVHFKNVQMG